MLDTLRQLERGFAAASFWTSSILTVAIAAILLLQVIGRHVLQYPFAWPEELAAFSFVWMIFTGLTVSYRSGSIIGIDWLTEAAPPRLRKLLLLLSAAVSVVTLSALIVVGVNAAIAALEVQTGVTRISWAWVYAALPLGCAMLLFSVLLDLIDLLCNRERITKGHEAAETQTKQV